MLKIHRFNYFGQSLGGSHCSRDWYQRFYDIGALDIIATSPNDPKEPHPNQQLMVPQ